MARVLRLLLASCALLVPAATAHADVVNYSLTCPVTVDQDKLETCEFQTDTTTVRSSKGDFRGTFAYNPGGCNVVFVELLVDGGMRKAFVMRQGDDHEALDLGHLSTGRAHTVAVHVISAKGRCKEHNFHVQVALGTDPIPGFQFHAHPTDDPTPGTEIDYSGRGWDSDGGDIFVYFGSRRVNRIPARSRFQGHAQYRPRVNDDCLEVLVARQRIAAGVLSRSIPVGGNPVVRVAFAQDMTVSRNRKSREVKPNSFICTYEDETVRLGPKAIFAGHAFRENVKIGGLLLRTNEMTVVSRPGQIAVDSVVAPIVTLAVPTATGSTTTRNTLLTFRAPSNVTAPCDGTPCTQIQPGQTGDLTIEGLTEVKGDLIVQGSLTVRGTIVVRGNLTVDGPTAGRGAVLTTGVARFLGPVNLAAEQFTAIGAAGGVSLCGVHPFCT